MKAVLIHRPGSIQYNSVDDPEFKEKDDIIPPLSKFCMPIKFSKNANTAESKPCSTLGDD
jgi:hypothetical protein